MSVAEKGSLGSGKAKLIEGGHAPSQPFATQPYELDLTDDAKPAPGRVNVIGFGSLLSEASAKSSFPNLKSFRLGRLKKYKRVFGHPAGIFFTRGIANMATKEMASLCVEPCRNAEFTVAVFDIPDAELAEFYIREEEFAVKEAEFHEMGGARGGTGLLCCRGSDEAYRKRYGDDVFEAKYGRFGITSIWGWKEQGLPIFPCRVYARHCVLAVQKAGDDAANDFLDNTYLYDRMTTLRQYLQMKPDIMDELPPPELASRYNG